MTTSESATPAHAPANAPAIVDVWSRTSPKYRRRSIILLLVTAALFAALGSFAYWLRSGIPFAPAMPNYSATWWQVFNPAAEEQISLTDLLVYPIHLEQVPMQIVVVGLLLASLVSVPILVAILYRFPASLIFTGIVAFLAMMPWLALCGTAACLIASWRKITFRYASAIIALIPIAAYFAVASQDSSRLASPMTPAKQVTLYYPWLIALIGSAVMMGLVLLITRIVNYRPGAIAPVLAVMFAIPWVIFETEVGRDELHYRLLERKYGPDSKFFDEGPAEAAINRAVMREIERDPDPQRDREAIRQNVIFYMTYLLEADELGLLAQRQYEVVRACEWFRNNFPRSRYIPNVLYIKGMAQDARIDLPRFRQDAYIDYYDEFPSHVSYDTWAAALHNFPESPVADVAAVQIARLTVRDGRVDNAIGVLERFRNPPAPPEEESERPRRSGWKLVFEKMPAESTLNIPTRVVVSQGRRLLDLLVNNRDARYGDAPLVEFFKLDPRYARYAENLDVLVDRFPGCALEDNVRVAAALTPRSTATRIRRLRRLLTLPASSDARPAAIYELAKVLQEDYQPAEAEELYRRVVAEHPSSPWADDARWALERLERLALAAKR
jgi:hypothetical protein